MLILVVHNGSHHADNVLSLAEEIVHGVSDMKLAILCESKDQARLQRSVRDPAARVLALGAHTEPVIDEADVSRVAGAARGALSRVSRSLLGVYSLWRKKIRGKSKLGDTLLDIIEYNSLACLLREKRLVQHFSAQIRDAHRVFELLQPDAVLAWGDRHVDIELPALVVARQRNIKVLLPYVASSSYRSLLWSRKLYGGPKCWTPFSIYRLLANFRLSSLTRQGYFFQEPHVMNAMRKVGALSSNPWTIGCGLSDIVCVDSAMTAARYCAEGVAAEKLHIVGSPEFDLLYRGLASREVLRNYIADRYQLPLGNGIIVVALPQFAEQGVLSWENHWSEIRYILRQLKRSGKAVLVSLHPRVEFEKYRFLEDEFGIRLSVDPLKMILPATDAFVAVNSSTLVWATLCGIKAFMLDYYGLDASAFEKLDSITPLRNRESLYTDLMTHLDAETDFSSDWKCLSRDWVFDGNVIGRYRDLIVQNPESTSSMIAADNSLRDFLAFHTSGHGH